MIRVRELSEIAHLSTLRADWNALLASTDNAIFSTWEWVTSWWKYFGEDRRLRVLIAEKDYRLIAIAPLMLSEYNLMKLHKLRKIEFIGTPQSDYNNLILGEDAAYCLKLFVRYMESLDDWDIVELRDVLDGSNSARLLCDYSLTSPWKLEKEVTVIAPYIELPCTTEELMKGLRPSLRHKLNRQSKRLRSSHRVVSKTYRDFSSVSEAMDVLFELHDKRRQSKGASPSGFLSRQTRAFYNDVAMAFAAAGWLDLNFLIVDDEPVAANLCFDYQGKIYGYQSGFDPRFGRDSVVSLLLLHSLEESIHRRLREYDLTRGAEPYKFRWPVHVRRCLTIGYARPRPLAKICWVAQKKRRQLSRALGRTALARIDEVNLNGTRQEMT